MKSEEQRRAADKVHFQFFSRIQTTLGVHTKTLLKAREELKRREEEEVMKQWEAATRRVAGAR